MAKAKRKELLSSAPWRGGGEESSDGDKFKDAKIKVTSNPGSTPTMHVPSKKKFSSADDDSLSEIDAELRYSFQRNFQFLQRVFSIDTIVKPLPPVMAYNVSRNLSFFTRIFTQFFGCFFFSFWADPEGISNAQKSLGLGQEEKVRRVR
ncbi:hypothetical protein CsSME_00048456 [Camellia sinensis var. sinensis]